MEAVENAVAEAVVVIAGDGRITLPSAVLAALEVKVGDALVLEFDARRPGQATVRAARTPLERLRADAKDRAQPLDLDEARRQFEQEFPRRDLAAPLTSGRGDE